MKGSNIYEHFVTKTSQTAFSRVKNRVSIFNPLMEHCGTGIIYIYFF